MLSKSTNNMNYYRQILLKKYRNKSYQTDVYKYSNPDIIKNEHLYLLNTFFNMRISLFFVLLLLILSANLSAQVNVEISEATIVPLDIQVVDVTNEIGGKQEKTQMTIFSEFYGENLLMYIKCKIENKFESKIEVYLSEITMDFKCCGRSYKLPLETCMAISNNSNISKDSILVVNPKESLNINFANFLSLNYCPRLIPLNVKKVIHDLNSRFNIKFKYVKFENKEIINSKLRIRNIKPYFLNNCVSINENRSICSIIFEIESQKSKTK